MQLSSYMRFFLRFLTIYVHFEIIPGNTMYKLQNSVRECSCLQRDTSRVVANKPLGRISSLSE